MIYDICTQDSVGPRRPAEHSGGLDMAMVRWTPFGTADLFDTFFGRPASGAPATRAWLPAVDMHETKDDLVLSVEVPGVSEKDVKVSINGDLLSIRGERRVDDEAKDRQYLHV